MSSLGLKKKEAGLVLKSVENDALIACRGSLSCPSDPLIGVSSLCISLSGGQFPDLDGEVNHRDNDGKSVQSHASELAFGGRNHLSLRHGMVASSDAEYDGSHWCRGAL